jgi:hypothetical protein
MSLDLRPLRVTQDESLHPKLESRTSPDWNPESQQALVAQAAPQELIDAFATAFKANAGRNARDEGPLPDAFLPFRDRTGTRAIGGERAFTGCLGNDRSLGESRDSIAGAK